MANRRTRSGAGVLGTLLLAPFLAQADATIANVATPAIRRDLGASGAAAELVVGGYLIAYAVLLITGARLGQTHGYKRLFLVGVGAFGTASLVAGLAPSATVLIVMRGLQGASAALMYPQALTGIQRAFSGEARARAIGSLALALASGAVIGQVLGGVLVSADIAGAGWRPVFLVNVPVCAAGLVAAVRVLPADDARAVKRLDLRGVAALSATLLLLVVPLSVGRSAGWPAWTWVCLAASVPAFWAFLAVERGEVGRGGHPLVDFGVVRRPAILLALLALVAATGTYYALLFTLAQYVQRGLGRGALASGLILVPWVAAFGVGGRIARRLPARVGRALALLAYLVLAGAYLAIGGLVLGGPPADAGLAVLLALGGLGLGTGFATLLAHLTNAVPGDYAPDISGVSTTALQIGGTLGVATLGSMYLGLSSAGARSAGHAFGITALALGATAAVAAGLAHRATRAQSAASSSRIPSKRR